MGSCRNEQAGINPIIPFRQITLFLNSQRSVLKKQQFTNKVIQMSDDFSKLYKKLRKQIWLKNYINALIINFFYRNFHMIRYILNYYEFKIAKSAATC